MERKMTKKMSQFEEEKKKDEKEEDDRLMN